MLIDKIPEEELAEQRLTIARALIKSQKYNNEQIRRFIFFLKTFIHIDNQKINSKFEREVDLLTGNKHAMGIIETIKMIEREDAFEEGVKKSLELGIEKGEEKRNHFLVTNLLLNTDFDISKIASLAGLTPEYVQQVKDQLEQ